MENKDKDMAKKPSKNIPMIVIGVIILVAIVVIAMAMNKRDGGQTNPEANNGQVGQTQDDGASGADGETPGSTDASVSADDSDLQTVEVEGIGEAKVVVPGANPITADNIVITETGQVAQNDAVTMSENAPKQTGFLNKEELPDGMVKLSIGNDKISPSEFTTTAGAPTTFSLTGVDEYSHVIAFEDPSLSAIAILVGPGQTKAITFNAPATAGTYKFVCASPGHTDKGEVGQMIVR